MDEVNLLKCVCLNCHWTWEVFSIEPDRNQECPECKSFDTRSFLKDFDI